MISELPPGILGDIYYQAKEIILRQCWSPHGDGGTDQDADKRISLEHAVRQATRRTIAPWACTERTEEEALRRLAGFLYLTGRLTRNPGHTHITDMVATWELDDQDLGDTEIMAILRVAEETIRQVSTAVMRWQQP